MDIDTAVLDAETTLINFAGKPVTFRRGEHGCTWTAITGTTNFETTDANGVVVSFQSQDFIGLAEELVLDEEPTAGPVEPQRGDRISRSLGARTLVHEVLNLSNAPCFRYSDSGRTVIRIHTKQVL